MTVAKISAIAAAAFQVTSALAQTPATSTVITGDPTERFSGIFGLGGHTCQQMDDTGRLHIFFEAMPNLTITNWLQISDGGTKPGVPMPDDLQAELPKIPGCAPNTHHAPTARKATFD
jgi:hypothetical protein